MSATILKFPFEQAYTTQLHRYLRRRLRDPSEVEDIVQEAYLRYLRMPSSYTVLDPAKYVFIIASNLAQDVNKRHAKSRVLYSTELAEGVAARLPDDSPDACRDLIAQEELRHTLAQMQPAPREVLLLIKRDGMDHREIAKRKGVKPNTVLNCLARAVAQARRTVT
jgi:RNA polymerase sigma factor (sigma-70 family)